MSELDYFMDLIKLSVHVNKFEITDIENMQKVKIIHLYLNSRYKLIFQFKLLNELRIDISGLSIYNENNKEIMYGFFSPKIILRKAF